MNSKIHFFANPCKILCAVTTSVLRGLSARNLQNIEVYAASLSLLFFTFLPFFKLCKYLPAISASIVCTFWAWLMSLSSMQDTYWQNKLLTTSLRLKLSKGQTLSYQEKLCWLKTREKAVKQKKLKIWAGYLAGCVTEGMVKWTGPSLFSVCLGIRFNTLIWNSPSNYPKQVVGRQLTAVSDVYFNVWWVWLQNCFWIKLTNTLFLWKLQF